MAMSKLTLTAPPDIITLAEQLARTETQAMTNIANTWFLGIMISVYWFYFANIQKNMEYLPVVQIPSQKIVIQKSFRYICMHVASFGVVATP